MSIVGFNINKIDVLKSEMSYANIQVANNINIKELLPANFNLGQAKQNGLKLLFEFSTVYGNNLAHIKLDGNVLLMASAENAKKILNDWNKSKRIDQKLLSVLINHINIRCSVQAVTLAKDVSLPSPIEIKPLVLSTKQSAPVEKAAKPAKVTEKKPAAKKKK